MHAYLVVGQNQNLVSAEIDVLIKSLGARRLDYELSTIDDVRQLNKSVSLSLGEPTAIVGLNFHLSSIPAQNAFLKSLEEPVSNLFYILSSSSIDLVSETIASRCSVIEISQTEKVDVEVVDLAEAFLTKMTIGERLVSLSKIKSRDDALLFVQNLIVGGHQIMIQEQKYERSMEAAIKTLRAIRLNGNVSLQLTNLAIIA